MRKLVVVGSGIKSFSHITEETKKIIQNSDKVLYLVNEDNLKNWIKREAKYSASLEPIYFDHPKRIDAYQAITNFIVNEYTKVSNLCVVFYGHPTVFADSALKAVQEIQNNAGHAVILPAVSAQDCLFSDLQIDPGDKGCFSIEATELLIYERSIDPYAHVILWQIANLGSFDTQKSDKLHILTEYLLGYYHANQPVCIYEAAILPLQKPRIEWIELVNLGVAELNSVSTLYIPPAKTAEPSNKYLSLLNIELQNFQLSTQSDTASK